MFDDSRVRFVYASARFRDEGDPSAKAVTVDRVTAYDGHSLYCLRILTAFNERPRKKDHSKSKQTSLYGAVVYLTPKLA